MELLGIVDFAVDIARTAQAADYTFGQSLRLIEVLARLRDLAGAKLTGLEPDLREDLVERFRYLLDGPITSLVSEGFYIFTESSEGVAPGLSDYYKEHRLRVLDSWEQVSAFALADTRIRAQVEELKCDSLRYWPLLGFASRQAYQDYVFPNTEVLLRPPNRTQLI